MPLVLVSSDTRMRKGFLLYANPPIDYSRTRMHQPTLDVGKTHKTSRTGVFVFRADGSAMQAVTRRSKHANRAGR